MTASTRTAVQLLGVARERRFSPGVHAAGDAAILHLTRAALVRAGYEAAIIEPAALTTDLPIARVVFAMCQSPEALAILQTWEDQGVLVVNRPAAVLACYRVELVRVLGSAALPFPRSIVLPLAGAVAGRCVAALLQAPAAGWWVKRGDVHAMQSDDVVFVSRPDEGYQALEGLRQRGIKHAVIQPHIPGQEMKFYAVRSAGVLHASTPQRHAIAPGQWRRLQALALQAGDLLDLEVYGGDAVVTPAGELYLIDINDWPSFRTCGAHAAAAIARYLIARGRQRGLL